MPHNFLEIEGYLFFSYERRNFYEEKEIIGYDTYNSSFNDN
jgi:hypothetical protein